MTESPKVLIPGEGPPEWRGRLTPERSISLAYAIVFYGFLALCAGVWIHFKGPRPIVEMFATHDLGWSILIGTGIGLGCVFLSWVSLKIFPWARLLEEEFGWMLGEQPRGDILVLAIASGMAEEIFFRGAMQPHLGLWGTSAVFGAIHFPINDRYRGWPVFAFVMGVLLGWEFQVTGTLWAPILTHTTVNFCNLWSIVTKYGTMPASSNQPEETDGQKHD